jgi:hypothetical protein
LSFYKLGRLYWQHFSTNANSEFSMIDGLPVAGSAAVSADSRAYFPNEHYRLQRALLPNGGATSQRSRESHKEEIFFTHPVHSYRRYYRVLPALDLFLHPASVCCTAARLAGGSWQNQVHLLTPLLRVNGYPLPIPGSTAPALQLLLLCAMPCPEQGWL